MVCNGAAFVPGARSLPFGATINSRAETAGRPTPRSAAEQSMNHRKGIAQISRFSSFLNSVWERTAVKLCFASAPGLETEFRVRRSQTEFGNEGTREVVTHQSRVIFTSPR